MVPPPDNRQLIERNVRIHGTFKNEVVLEFNEYNAKVEAFIFTENHAITLEASDSKFENMPVMTDGSSDSDHTKTQKSNSMDMENNSLDSK